MSHRISAVVLDWTTPVPSMAFVLVKVAILMKKTSSAGLPCSSFTKTFTRRSVRGESGRLLFTFRLASKASRSRVASCRISSLTSAQKVVRALATGAASPSAMIAPSVTASRRERR